MKNINIYRKYHEVISYLFWGIMTTVVSWGSYSLFTVVFGELKGTLHVFALNISPVVLISNALSWICAVLFAFITNKLIVFQSKSWEFSVFINELWKFLLARIATGIIEITGVPLLVSVGLEQSIFGIEGMLSKVIVSSLVVVVNYVVSKLFIFRKSSTSGVN